MANLIVATMVVQFMRLVADIVQLLMPIWNKALQLCWRVNGVRYHLDQMKAGREDTSAQVLKIRYRLPLRIFHEPHDFLVTHESFRSAEIIHDEHIHLFTIDDTWANFIVTDDSENIFNTRKYPILTTSLPLRATKLVRVPVAKFYEMVDKIDISDRRVVWLFHTGRCGSTLLAQVFNSLPNWSAVSESPCMAASLYRECISKRNVLDFVRHEKYERLVNAAVKITIAKFPEGSNVFWKTTGFDVLMASGVLPKLFPKHEMLFNYRDVLPSAKSLAKIMSFYPYSGVRHQHIFKLCDPRYMIQSSNFTYGDVITRGRGAWFQLEVLHWAVNVKVILGLHGRGVIIPSVRYEDLVTDKEGTITKLFDHLRISKTYLGYALDAMKEDSQMNARASREARKALPDWVRTGEEVDRCNSLLEELGFPDIDSSFILPHTL